MILLALLAAVAMGGLGQAFPGAGGNRLVQSLGDTYQQITHQVFWYVQKKYVEPERADPRGMLQGAFQSLETQYPEVLVEVAEDQATVRVDQVSQVFSLQRADRFSSAAELLNEVLGFVHAQLGDEVDKKDLFYFALNGALSNLDPHSNVFSPKYFKEFMIGTRGSFGGIGFVFGIRDGDMTIITPIDDTPAARGGLRSGDRILYIDGEPTINMAVDLAANKMRGEPGTQVTLTLAREGWPEPKAITFTREVIHVDSVESHVLDGPGQAPVLYAKVKNFQKNTTQELRKAVQAAEKGETPVRGIILDLRNNPGGLLEQAIALSEGFLDEGTIVSTRGPEADANSRSEARADPPISALPLVVLINQGSASASEIVSGALKPTRALLVGQKTFGKGSVQKLFPLTDGGALKLTVAQYLTPGDISIQSIGIQPDIAVYPARVVEKQLRLGPPPDHMQEADLDNAFTEWGNSSGNPQAELQFFQPTPEDEEGEGERSFAELSGAEKRQRIAEDFEVRFARQVFAALPPGAASRNALVAAARSVIETVRGEETARIREALEGFGVQWDGAPAGDGVALQVLASDAVRLPGGETTEVSLRVTNTGTAAAHRVWGRTESDNPWLDNLDFVFGTIAPGETRSWSHPVEVPKSAPDRWDTFTLHLRAAGLAEAGDGTGTARIVAQAKPEFAYRYSLADENTADPGRSGDGVLEVGERVRLGLEVVNRGGATSNTAEVNIRGDEKEELYLEVARHKLEGLAAGQSAAAPMTFRLVKATEDGDVVVGVSVADRDYSAFFGDSLKIDLGQPYPAEQTRFPPEFSFPQALPLRTVSDRLAVQVVVTDDQAVVDFYAYLGKDKVYYTRNSAASGQLPATFEVPLEMGSNRLVLSARDNQHLSATRTYLIYRDAVQAAARSGAVNSK
jgi:carboxyl-terminal processing protease